MVVLLKRIGSEWVNRRLTNLYLLPMEYFPFLETRHKQDAMSAIILYIDLIVINPHFIEKRQHH